MNFTKTRHFIKVTNYFSTLISFSFSKSICCNKIIFKKLTTNNQKKIRLLGSCDNFCDGFTKVSDKGWTSFRRRRDNFDFVVALALKSVTGDDNQRVRKTTTRERHRQGSTTRHQQQRPKGVSNPIFGMIFPFFSYSLLIQ